MVTEHFQQYHQHFGRFAESRWSHPSSLTILLIVLNISLFFLTNLVTKQGCHYTLPSLPGFAIASLGPLLPIGLLDRLWYYLALMASEMVGIYFLVTFIWYWITSNSG